MTGIEPEDLSPEQRRDQTGQRESSLPRWVSRLTGTVMALAVMLAVVVIVFAIAWRFVVWLFA